jgi:hypothetical protein
MDETDEDEYWQLQQGLWGSRVQESMRGRQKVRTNPSQEDRKVRRRQRRATAGGDVEKRAELVRALNRTSNFQEQVALLDQIRKLDEGIQAKAAQGRELDFADTVVRETLTPVSTFQHHTAATDWLGDVTQVDPQWQNRVVAEASMWFGRVPEFVKQDGEEFAIQAQGKARQFAGQFGLQATAAQKTFLDYVGFLYKQSASGLDQIQQTVDPNNQPKTTPLPTETFDTFAPEVDPINAGVSGTETSDRAPLIQEIVNGGSGADGGAPEKPGGHSEGDELSWAPPQGMQQDTAPGWSDGDPGAPEKGGDRPDYTKQSSLYGGPGMAIGYTMNMDEFRAKAAAQKAARKAGGQGKGRKEAASGLPQIQETVDANNQPHAPSPLPPDVAFPLDDEFQEEWTTNGTGNAAPGKAQAKKKQASHGCSDCGGTISGGKCKKCGQECSCAQCKKSKTSSVQKKADMFGNSDTPHAVPQQEVANTPETTPPTAQNAGGAAAGRADAQAGNAPTFGDDSSFVPTPAEQYPEGYQSMTQSAGEPDVPASVAGPGNGVTRAGSKVSSLIVTAAERENADFRKGYGYASKWKPGTRLVSTGSKEFEAGVYAGISDNPEHQKAFVAAHRAVMKKFPKVAARVEQHVRVTHRVAAKNEHPSNGLYLMASTSMDLDTTAPNTTPAADGSTPINGPGRPGPLDGQQDAAAPGGPAPYNGAPPYGSPVVPGAAQAEPSPADALIGGGGMSTPNQVMGKQSLAFRKRVQAGLLAERQGK